MKNISKIAAGAAICTLVGSVVPTNVMNMIGSSVEAATTSSIKFWNTDLEAGKGQFIIATTEAVDITTAEPLVFDVEISGVKLSTGMFTKATPTEACDMVVKITGENTATITLSNASLALNANVGLVAINVDLATNGLTSTTVKVFNVQEGSNTDTTATTATLNTVVSATGIEIDQEEATTVKVGDTIDLTKYITLITGDENTTTTDTVEALIADKTIEFAVMGTEIEIDGTTATAVEASTSEITVIVQFNGKYEGELIFNVDNKIESFDVENTQVEIGKSITVAAADAIELSDENGAVAYSLVTNTDSNVKVSIDATTGAITVSSIGTEEADVRVGVIATITLADGTTETVTDYFTVYVRESYNMFDEVPQDEVTTPDSEEEDLEGEVGDDADDTLAGDTTTEDATTEDATTEEEEDTTVDGEDAESPSTGDINVMSITSMLGASFAGTIGLLKAGRKNNKK